MNSEGNQYEPIIFTKKTKQNTSNIPHRTYQESVEIKLENDDELKRKQTNLELRNLIKQKRIEKGLTQQQLAISVNVKSDVINKIESGKLLSPEPKLISEIKKKLGIIMKLVKK